MMDRQNVDLKAVLLPLTTSVIMSVYRRALLISTSNSNVGESGSDIKRVVFIIITFIPSYLLVISLY